VVDVVVLEIRTAVGHNPALTSPLSRNHSTYTSTACVRAMCCTCLAGASAWNISVLPVRWVRLGADWALLLPACKAQKRVQAGSASKLTLSVQGPQLPACSSDGSTHAYRDCLDHGQRRHAAGGSISIQHRSACTHVANTASTYQLAAMLGITLPRSRRWHAHAVLGTVLVSVTSDTLQPFTAFQLCKYHKHPSPATLTTPHPCTAQTGEAPTLEAHGHHAIKLLTCQHPPPQPPCM
jgi:hypothetical protein